MGSTKIFKILLSVMFFFLFTILADYNTVKAISYEYKKGFLEVKSTNDVVVNSFSYDYLTVFDEGIKDGDVDLSEYKFYSSNKIEVNIDNYNHWFHIKDNDETSIYKYNANSGNFDILMGSYEKGVYSLDKDGVYKIKYQLESSVVVNYVYISNSMHHFNIDINHQNPEISVFNNFKFDIEMADGLDLSLNTYSYYFGDSDNEAEYVNLPYSVFSNSSINEVDSSISLKFDSKFVSENDSDKKYFFIKAVDPNGNVKFKYQSSERYLLANEVKAVVNIVDIHGNVVNARDDKVYYVTGDTINFKISLNVPVIYQNLLYSVGNGDFFTIKDSLDEPKDYILLSYNVTDANSFEGDFSLITKNSIDAIVKYEGENVAVDVNTSNVNFSVDVTNPEISINTNGLADGSRYYNVVLNVEDDNLKEILYYVAECKISQGGKCLDKYDETNKEMLTASFSTSGNQNEAVITIDESIGKYDKRNLVLFVKAIDKAGNVSTASKDGYVIDNVIIPKDGQDNLFIHEDILNSERVVGQKISVIVREEYEVYSISYNLGEEKECVLNDVIEAGVFKYDCFSVDYDFKYNLMFKIVDIHGNIENYESNFRYSTIENETTENIPFKDSVSTVTLYNEKLYEIEYIENNLMRLDVDVAVLDSSTFDKINQIFNLDNIPKLTDLSVKLVYFDNQDNEIQLVSNIKETYKLPDLESIQELLDGRFDFKTCAISKCEISLYLKYEYKTDGVLQERYMRIKYVDNSNKFIVDHLVDDVIVEVGGSYESPSYQFVTNLNVKIDPLKVTRIVDIVRIDELGNVTNVDAIDTNMLGTYIVKESFVYNSVVSFPLKYSITIKDTTAPTIRLNGDETVTIKVGDEFKDPLVIVNDNYDKKMDVLTKFEPSFNENKIGTYKISYWVVDSSGNVSEVVTRTVIVEPKNNMVTYLIIVGIIALVALVGIVGYKKEFKRKKNG